MSDGLTWNKLNELTAELASDHCDKYHLIISDQAADFLTRVLPTYIKLKWSRKRKLGWWRREIKRCLLIKDIYPVDFNLQ